MNSSQRAIALACATAIALLFAANVRATGNLRQVHKPRFGGVSFDARVNATNDEIALTMGFECAKE